MKFLKIAVGCWALIAGTACTLAQASPGLPIYVVSYQTPMTLTVQEGTLEVAPGAGFGYIVTLTDVDTWGQGNSTFVAADGTINLNWSIASIWPYWCTPGGQFADGHVNFTVYGYARLVEGVYVDAYTASDSIPEQIPNIYLHRDPDVGGCFKIVHVRAPEPKG